MKIVTLDKDYHEHQNFVVILGIIAVLVIAMVGVSMAGLSKSTHVLTIGALATIQFYIVLSNLMHLKFEPALIKLFAYLSVIFIVMWIFAVIPDSVMIPLVITQ